MGRGNIFTVETDGTIKRMTPSAPENEDRMQALVASYPELITDEDGDLLLVQREQSIGDSETSSGRWSVDHLFVTTNAVPVLVELKRAVDTRLRREVVGQMLDYAANATAYWQPGKIAESFLQTAEEAGADADMLLEEYLGQQDPSTFWEQVDANFKAGRVKLVFVADEIPRELARIVEFLNEQMRADVRAIELRWFTGDEGQVTLSPRVIGATERSAASKGLGQPLEPISREDWLEKFISGHGEASRKGSEIFLNLVESLEGEAGVARTQGSISGAFPDCSGKAIYPLRLWKDGKLTLGFEYLKGRDPFQSIEERQKLYDELVTAVGPLTTKNLDGSPGFPVDRLVNPTTASNYKHWLVQLVTRLSEGQ